VVVYSNFELFKLKQAYIANSKVVQENSKCLLVEASTSKNIAEICSSKIFNYSLIDNERAIQFSKILCSNDFLESCEDLNFLNSSWRSITTSSLKNKTRPLRDCLKEYNENCREWIDIANAVGDFELVAYLQGENCINEYYENTKNKASLTACFRNIRINKIFSPSTNLEFYNELCSKICDKKNSCPTQVECKHSSNILKLQAVLSPSQFEDGLATIEKNKTLENYLKSPASVANICTEDKLNCNDFFKNSIVHFNILESELQLNGNKIEETGKTDQFFKYFSPEKNKLSPISKLWTEYYRLRRIKKIEELTLSAINTFNNKSHDEKLQLKNNYVSDFKHNSNYDTTFYKKLEELEAFKTIYREKLLFEPIDSFTPEVAERIKKYYCENTSDYSNCSFIFKNLKEAYNNQPLLQKFCSKNDILSCEILKQKQAVNLTLPPSNLITTLKQNYKKEVQSTFADKTSSYLAENLRLIIIVFFITISLLVLFLTYTYFSHLELINHFKATWKKEGEKKASSILNKLNKNNKSE